MKRLLLVIVFVLSGAAIASAQDSSVVRKQHKFFINTDLVYDIESIPTIGCERFTYTNGHMRSWRVDAGYQVHFNDSFGVVFSHGDKIGIGVYQGPFVRVGYSIYSARHRRKWHNYISPALCMKYLWYDDEYVNTGHRNHDGSFRVQSEQCVAAVPQLTVGSKHISGHFCADFYFGIQLPVKYRDITVSVDHDSHGHYSAQVPYQHEAVNVTVAPVLGIRIGYIK